MKRVRVESSSIASVGYDEASRSLEVEFLHGAVYRYAEVPRAVYAALLAAESKGSFFNSAIRDAYEFHQVLTR